jgi:hypothetical protein
MFADLFYRLRSLFRRDAVEHELHDELQLHLDRDVEKRMSFGATREEAARQAQLALGGFEQVKEECRQARGVSVIETAIQDVRYSLRGLRKNPGFAAVAVVSLALGIGANTAIFSLIDAVMLRMLPVRDPDSLLLIGRSAEGVTRYGFPYRSFRLLRDNDTSLATIAAYSPIRVSVGIDGAMEPAADAQLVTGNYFSVLGVSAAAGRTIAPDDDRVPNGHPVTMISHGYWKRRFGQSPAIIGRAITLCGRTFTIIGVTPPEFFGMEVGVSPDFFAPVMMQPALMPATENLLAERPILTSIWLRAFGRRKDGVSIVQAATVLDELYRQTQVTRGTSAARGNGKAAPEERIVLTSVRYGVAGGRLLEAFRGPVLHRFTDRRRARAPDLGRFGDADYRRAWLPGFDARILG